MKILNELDELIEHSIITRDTAQDIKNYYTAKKEANPIGMLAVFGMFGALLTGLGLILIFAHNWDNFSQGVKVVLALVPLFIAQAATGYAILKNKNSIFKNIAGILLFFTVGASIALVSQIYNLPGSISSLLMTWIVLCMPLVYLLRSNALFILLLFFSTFYCVEAGYYNYGFPVMYLVFIAALLPFYVNQLKIMPQGNAAIVNNFLLPLSFITCLGTFLNGSDVFGFVIYIALFGILYSLGQLGTFAKYKVRNGYTVLGMAGTAGLLLFLSFKWIWQEVATAHTPGLYFIGIALLFIAAAGYLAWLNMKTKKEISLFAGIAFIFPVIYVTGFINYIIPVVLINTLVVALGIFTIRKGISNYDFTGLNFGMLIIAILIICRFFDTNISFVLRGILFILVGAGFFMANYRLAKKKNNTTLNQE